MIAPVSLPIFVDVDVSEEEYEVDMDTAIEIETIVPGGLPTGGSPGDILMKRSGADYDAEWVPPATSAEQDNTRPITAGAVYTEIGNINALLATI